MNSTTHGRLAEYARRVGIPVHDPEYEARKRLAELQTAQGAARDNVYHPPVSPWNGHPVDVVWSDHGPVPIDRRIWIAITLAVIVGAVLGWVWPL